METIILTSIGFALVGLGQSERANCTHSVIFASDIQQTGVVSKQIEYVSKLQAEFTVEVYGF